MIDRKALLSDLQKLLKRLEADLLERSASDEVPAIEVALRAEYERAKAAQRTAQNYEDWRTDAITQAAAAWVLSCVFVRFLEDNRLVDPPHIAGPGDRLQRARDEHELYFRERPTETDREYLLALFDQLSQLPGTADIFGAHNPIRELPNWLSGDAAGELLEFFQRIDANSGTLVHDFTDAAWDTRFLGDLYQDLSEAARKKYALLQTPEFVEEFILDRTLDPALDEFGLLPPLSPGGRGAGGEGGRNGSAGGEGEATDRYFKLIDPACGSGHFLLGAFRRILDRWQRQEPGTNVRELVQRTLDSIYGVDVNPFAVAIARFRLLLAAMRACGIKRLADAPGFRLNIACGDSLLHGVGEQQTFGWRDTDHVTQAEDLAELQRILRPGAYHAVVANPPYITPKDRALNNAYRERYSTCHMKYSLAVPFMQRLFQLALRGDGNGHAAGYTGQITANSFMKREFGKKLIESFLPTVDLTHVIDTSGAYIPGHGTPTVILFGQNRPPVASALRTVMGIRGEPATPDDPAQGLVWSAVVAQVDQPGSQSEYVSVGDSPREQFHKHPWSIGGGGAAELKERLDESCEIKLSAVVDCIGFSAILGEDEAFGAPVGTNRIRKLPLELRRPIIEGDKVRDWSLNWDTEVLFPYTSSISLRDDQLVKDWCWRLRSLLAARADFSKRTYAECGRPFWEYHQIPVERNRIPLSIVFAEVATHNHFVLDRGGKVFKQTAPVIKLPADATEDDHIALLGLLNSSTACFWMKQVCFPKGTTTGDISKEKGKAEANRFAFNATSIGNLPLPNWSDSTRRQVIELARKITSRATLVSDLSSDKRIDSHIDNSGAASLRKALANDCTLIAQVKGEMVFLQEELDWVVYAAYGIADRLCDGILERDIPSIAATERTFCCCSTKTTLPATLRNLWNSRSCAIHEIETLRLIETPVYKRPWAGRQGVYGSSSRTITEKQHDVQTLWLLNRLESYFDFDGRMNEAGQPTATLDIELISVSRMADVARQDAEFQQVGELYRDDAAFDVEALVTELVAAESVPLLPALRYKPSGLIKRGTWERTWDLQRQEDLLSDQLSAVSDQLEKATDAAERTRLQAEQEKLTAECRTLTASLTVPTKYTSADFLKSDYWRLRGKLDVPKERWISFPHCEGPDGTPVVCWAGYDHLQQARAISAYYVRVQTEFGGTDDPRLVPLLACLVELLPWLRQWHNEPDPNFDGLRMGDYFEGFVQEEARALPRADGGTGWTVEEIKAWAPVKQAGGWARRRSRT